MFKHSEREIIVLVSHAQKGCPASKDILVKHYKQMICSIVKRSTAFFEKEDGIQEGMKALLLAISHFNTEKGEKFTGFLSATVRGEIRRYTRDCNLLKIPRSVYDTAKEIKVFRQQFINQYGKLPMPCEIRRELQLTPTQFALAENSSYTRLSLHEPSPFCVDEQTNQPLPIEQCIGDTTNPFSKKEWEVLLEETIDQTLSPFEQKIIRYRFYSNYSQKQTATMLNVNQMKISRTEKRIMKKMYQHLTEDII